MFIQLREAVESAVKPGLVSLLSVMCCSSSVALPMLEPLKLVPLVHYETERRSNAYPKALNIPVRKSFLSKSFADRIGVLLGINVRVCVTHLLLPCVFCAFI